MVTAPGDLIAAGANLYVNSVESMLDRVVSAEKYAAQHFLSGLNALSNDALTENYGWVQNVLNDKHETDTQIGSTLNSALNTAYNVTSTVSNLDTNKILSGLNAGWEGTKKGIDSGFNKLGNWAVEYKANAGNAYSSANFVDLSKNAKDVIDIASILVPVAVLAKGKMVAKAFDYKIKPISIKDLKHADQWGAENFSAWIDELPKKEKQAIIDYTGNGYIGINDYLRGKIDITHVDLEKISDISTALEKAVLPHDIKVFRGVNIDALNSIISKSETISGKVDLNNIIGKSLNETGFMSTSVLEKASFNYKQVIMEIHAPKGTNGAYLDHISQVPGEAEILFNKGQTMLIKDATLNGDNQIKLLLEIIKDK